MIGRPDLASPRHKVHELVCSRHFDSSAIKYIPKLLPNALPTKLLPSDPSTSPSISESKTKEISTQTCSTDDSTSTISAMATKTVEMKSVQTTDDMSIDEPAKRKVTEKNKESNLKRTRLNDLDKIEQEVPVKEEQSDK